MMRFFQIVLLAISSLIFAPAAWAQSTLNHSFVSRDGLDSNTCESPAQACKYISTAENRTVSGGRLTCIDAFANTEAVELTQSIAIYCPGVSVLALNIVLAADEWVIVDGLSMFGSSYFANRPLSIYGAGTVTLNDLYVGPAHASIKNSVTVQPTGALALTLTNSRVDSSGVDPAGGGIIIKPLSGGSARVAIENSILSGNVFGIAFDGTGSSAGMNATISNSLISASKQDGILATSSPDKAPIGVFVSNSRSINNNIGIRSIGSNVTIRVEGSKIIGNGTGLATAGGGALLSGGNNFVQANAVNGSFSGAVPAQ